MNQQLLVSDCDRTRDLSTTLGGSPSCYSTELRCLLAMCLRSHDELLWNEFVGRTRPFIVVVVHKTMLRCANHSSSLVEDLVQETYLKLCGNDFKALREFGCEHDNALFGFLKVVASNVVRDHFRSSYSQKRGCGREEEDLDNVPMSLSFCTRSVEDADRRILLDEIDDCFVGRAADPTFPRDYAIFWLYYGDGLTARAIAARPSVGLTVKGVESTLLRLTRAVRTELTGRECRAAN